MAVVGRAGGQRGESLDVNVYFVGVSQGRHGPSVEDALRGASGVYAQAGLRIGQVRRFEVGGDDARRFSIIRSVDDVLAIGRLSSVPGGEAAATVQERLSLNLFVVDQILMEGGGVLGVSAGLPGPAGSHGGLGAGVVVTAEVIDDVGLMGRVIAHEAGHYLGLFHTTEAGGQAADPVRDTPECDPSTWVRQQAEFCPDARNLMFPFAGLGSDALSPDQADVLHANPLVR